MRKDVQNQLNLGNLKWKKKLFGESFIFEAFTLWNKYYILLSEYSLTAFCRTCSKVTVSDHVIIICLPGPTIAYTQPRHVPGRKDIAAYQGYSQQDRRGVGHQD